MTDLRTPEQLDPKAKVKVWEELKLAGEPLSVEELYTRVDRPPRTVRNAIEDLKESGLANDWHRTDNPKLRMVALVE